MKHKRAKRRYTVIYNRALGSMIHTGAIARVLTRDLPKTLKADRFQDLVGVLSGWPKQVQT
jgi:hypothetical protein